MRMNELIVDLYTALRTGSLSDINDIKEAGFCLSKCPDFYGPHMRALFEGICNGPIWLDNQYHYLTLSDNALAPLITLEALLTGMLSNLSVAELKDSL